MAEILERYPVFIDVLTDMVKDYIKIQSRNINRVKIVESISEIKRLLAEDDYKFLERVLIRDLLNTNEVVIKNQ